MNALLTILARDAYLAEVRNGCKDAVILREKIDKARDKYDDVSRSIAGLADGPESSLINCTGRFESFPRSLLTI